MSADEPGSRDVTVPPPGSEEPTLAPGEEGNPTFAQAWAQFQSQGGMDLAPGASLTGELTLSPADTDPFALGPAEVELAGLEPLNLEGPDADFRPTDLLGSGGMGEVRVAVDRSLRREVALKTVRRGSGTRGGRSLMQEALYTGYLEHPNVVPVHRLGRDESGQPVMVMKRVVGTSWAALLRDPEHASWENLPEDRLLANLDILASVCDALRYAHGHGILHRDIKPANVMVGSFGEVYLVDWGLGIRLEDLPASPEAMVGTLSYMAPEMLENPRSVNERTDVYLLGSTLHQVLVGRPRHDADAHYNAMLSVFRSDPFDYAPEIPRELAELCNRATSPRPEERPASALEFRRALERFIEHRGSLTLTDGARERLEELRAEYASPGDDTTRRARLFDACRFGFDQALRIWPENDDAREGLQECLELTIERALEAKNPGLIETLLPSLPQQRPELEERLRALQAELAAAADAPAKLEALEREHDLRVGGRQRAMGMVVLAVIGYGLLLALMVAVKTGTVAFDYPVIVGAGGLMGVLLIAHLAMARSWLLANEANRRMVKMVAGTWGCSMLAATSCWAYGIPGGTFILIVSLLMTMLVAMMAATIDRRLWISFGIAIVASVFSMFAPGMDPLAMNVIGGTLVFASIAFFWLRDPPR